MILQDSKLLLVPILATAMFSGCGSANNDGPANRAERPPTRVMTHRVERESLIDEIQALGTAGANESVEIKPRVASIVTKIAFTEGQRVTTGTLLIELENSEIRAGLAVAEASLSESRSSYNRSRSLIDTQVISAANLEQLQAAMQVDEAQVQAAKARLANTRIHAPFDGRIGLRRVSLGGFVDSSTVITTLDDTAIIKLDFTVPEAFLAVIKEGMAISANSLVYPDQPFIGTVDSIDTRLDPVARSVQVRALLPNSDGLLKPGMFMSVNLQRDRGLVLVVPEESIVPERGSQYVFIVSDGIATRREIKLGRRVPGAVEIVSGLQDGELVVTEGTHKLRDGSPVETVQFRTAGSNTLTGAD